jgi:hypothetical protein
MMTVYDYISENRKQIFKFYQVGLIGSSLISDFEVYQFYLDCRRTKNSIRISKRMTLLHFEINRMRLHRIRKKMQQSL